MRPFAKVMRRVVDGGSIAYSAAVLAVTVLLWRVGEGWWVTAVGLYVPRVVFALPLPPLALAAARWGSRRYLGLLAATLGVVLVPLMGLTVPAPSLRFGRPPGPHLRLLSYNVGGSLGGNDKLVAEVDRYAPDVVFMQELGDPTALAAAMRSRYPTVVVSTQFLIAARYPELSEVSPDKIDFAGRRRSPRFVAVTLQTPLGDVVFYDVHPLSPRDAFDRLRGRNLRHEIVSGHILSGDAAPAILENASLRDRQVEAFADAAGRETLPTIVAGDTNLPGLSPILRRRLSRFQDGFEKAGWGFGYTFPTDGAPWMRIDRVFASDDLRFTSVRVGTSLASDHHCVVADVERK